MDASRHRSRHQVPSVGYDQRGVATPDQMPFHDDSISQMAILAGRGDPDHERDIATVWRRLAGKKCSFKDASLAASLHTGDVCLGKTVWCLAGRLFPDLGPANDTHSQRIDFPAPSQEDVILMASHVGQSCQDPLRWIANVSSLVRRLRENSAGQHLAQHLVDICATDTRHVVSVLAGDVASPLPIEQVEHLVTLWPDRTPSQTLIDCAVTGVSGHDPAVNASWMGVLAQVTAHRERSTALSSDPWTMLAMTEGFAPDEGAAGLARLAARNMDRCPNHLLFHRDTNDLRWNAALIHVGALEHTQEGLRTSTPTTPRVLQGVIDSCTRSQRRVREGCDAIERAVDVVRHLRSSGFDADAQSADQVVVGCAPAAKTLLAHLLPAAREYQQGFPQYFQSFSNTPVSGDPDPYLRDARALMVILPSAAARSPLVDHAVTRIRDGGVCWLEILAAAGHEATS